MSLHAVRPLPDNAYTRALRGAVPVPAGGKDKLAFQVLMVFCMVTCMVTLNWLIHASDRSLATFSEVLYEYPLTFIAALFVRTVVARVGHAGLNAVWAAPDHLPRPGELARPDQWIERLGL